MNDLAKTMQTTARQYREQGADAPNGKLPCRTWLTGTGPIATNRVNGASAGMNRNHEQENRI